jgi:23S rRNA (cytosine1962-C5)-methyltransferase
MTYVLLDSGNEQKLERFGDLILVRPASQAIWKPSLSDTQWKNADARFTRDEGKGWKVRTKLPSKWNVEIEGIQFKIAPTDFGHVGLFPEHSHLWRHFVPLIQKANKTPHILNLFAYSGGATLAAAKAGAKVCHLDASQGMVAWARENAELNRLSAAPIRWIVDDVNKFLAREIKRGVRYDGIILDPPSFGRGSQGEVFKIEEHILPILDKCRQLLSDTPLFVVLSSHTPGMTPLVMRHLLDQMLPRGSLREGEMIITAPTGFNLPAGSYAMVTYET